MIFDRDLMYVPLNLPFINVNRIQLLEWWDRKSVRTQAYPETGNSWKTAQHSESIDPELNEIVPGIAEYCRYLQLPRYRVTILEQIKELPAHCDAKDRKRNIKDYVKFSAFWPCDFRMWLVNDQPDDAFYMVNTDNGKTLYPQWNTPIIGSPWVFNALDRTIWHGSHALKPNTRKLILAINPLELPDTDVHSKLVCDSVIRYSDMAIWRKDFI